MKYGSFYDNKGKLYVDCTDCSRGHFGEDVDKCSAGWKFKKKNISGCYIGDIMENVDKEKLERLT